ncbi:MAG: hypothetical protein JW751_11655 [Polyangiaceae bacterium]|nr:hypothetical protein [Polyangiaceae bacterium]
MTFQRPYPGGSARPFPLFRGLARLWWLPPLTCLAAACEEGGRRPPHPSGSGGAAGAPAGGGTQLLSEGGANAGAVFLGRRCITSIDTTSIDCGDRLECLTVDSEAFDGEGPPGGYCTLPCADDPAICEELAAGASCQEVGGTGERYCLLGCELGELASGSGAKCHGRRDTACEEPRSGAGGAACVPRCNADTDCCAPGVVCGPARYCNPSTGLCSTERRSGSSIGSRCSGVEDDSCRGVCRAVEGSHGSRFACSEPCTFGASPACGFFPEAGSARAYCYLANNLFVAAARVAGDGGYCAPACDCNDDCADGFACLAFSESRDVLATGRSGVCVWATAAGRGVACGGAGGVSAGGARAVASGASGEPAAPSFGGSAGLGGTRPGHAGGPMTAGTAPVGLGGSEGGAGGIAAIAGASNRGGEAGTARAGRSPIDPVEGGGRGGDPPGAAQAGTGTPAGGEGGSAGGAAIDETPFGGSAGSASSLGHPASGLDDGFGA